MSEDSNNEKEINSAENHNSTEIDESNIDGSTSEKGEDVDIIVDKSDKKEDLKKKKEFKHKQQLMWVKTLTFSNVVLDGPKKSVVSIGGVPYASINVPVIASFLRQQDIQVINRRRKKGDMEELILQHMKGSQYREKVISASKRKTSAKTKPSVLTEDGTLYRVVNVITCEKGKEYYITTRKQFERNDLDGKLPHAEAWESMADIYQDELCVDIDTVSDPRKEMVGYGVDELIPMKYDELNTGDFKCVVEYIMAHYKEVMNNKVVSGQHKQFSDFVHGKHWLHYLNIRLQDLGDKGLIDCCYVQLKDDVKIAGSKVVSRKSSPSPSEGNTKRQRMAKLQDLADAKIQATQTIQKKNDSIMQHMNWARLHEVQEKISVLEEDMDDVENQIRARHLKRRMKQLKQEYETLKVSVGYQSSSDDDSDN